MRRGLRFLAVSVPILIRLAINIVVAAPGKKAANLETRTRRIYDLATQADIVNKPMSALCQKQTSILAAVSLKSDRMF